MKLTRDSAALWVGVGVGVVLYLAGNKPIMEWSYYEWLAAAGYALSVVSAQLGTSPLKGANDASK
jgi:hypothetical protein